MPAPNEITPNQLLRLIGTSKCPVIVDICTAEDHALDPVLIPTAIRASHTDIPAIQSRIGDRPAVIVCQKGKKLSQAVAAYLRADGLRAEFLSGGMVAWRGMQDAPSVPSASIPGPVNGASLWVTRHRPKIDRIACPWLIRRFIDPAARFLFVAPSEVLNVTDRMGATAFDVDGAVLAHSAGQCTFDAMLRTFNLATPALRRMADIIRAADTGRGSHPAAAGLLAVSVGLSRQYRDDNQQLDAGMTLYDALYLWARDGFEETHASAPRANLQ